MPSQAGPFRGCFTSTPAAELSKEGKVGGGRKISNVEAIVESSLNLNICLIPELLFQNDGTEEHRFGSV